MKNQNTKAHYIMIGGFLGSGKTTAILKLAQHLTNQGLRLGLITNDQGHGLVDTIKVASHGFPVAEIPGGCFCCRFNSLMEAADELTQSTRPDVFIAEPVGSCTDLIASVSYPLRRIYGERFSIAPLSVLLDPKRAMAMLGLSNGRHFSKKVAYIYHKQLEEATTIVINKIDQMNESNLASLEQVLAHRYPQAKLLACSAREGTGLEDWFNQITEDEQPTGETIEVDYQIYARGEALLGWLNATVAFRANSLVDGDAVLAQMTESVSQQLSALHIEIAHFKMTLSPNDGSGELAVINLVGNDREPEFSQMLSDPLDEGQLIVNLRAEGAPECLGAALQGALTAVSLRFSGLSLDLEHCEKFRPGKPVPVHRFSNEYDGMVQTV